MQRKWSCLSYFQWKDLLQNQKYLWIQDGKIDEIYKFDGLICTDIAINFRGKEKILKNVVIDTGAVQSIINSSSVSDINIEPETLEELNTTHGIGGEMFFFSKVVDSIKISECQFENIELDFGEIDPKGELMGLIGLDLLEKYRALIDVELPSVTMKAT